MPRRLPLRCRDPMTIAPPPPILRLRIDETALAANWRALDRLSGSARAGAAIKADCYGLGIDRCLPVLRDAGARDFFVAHWQEVPRALRHIEGSALSVLHGPMNPEEARFAQQTGVRPVINSLRQAAIWLESGGGPCHLMVDTGIIRLGLALREVGDPIVSQLEIVVLMSHLACADEISEMNARQLGAFRDVVAAIPHRCASLANSAGIGLGEDFCFDLTRPGLSLYGGVPSPALDGVVRQVAYPEAQIMMVRELSAGDKVGYNATFTAPRPMRAGVVSLGYADGILRAWRGAAFQSADRQLPILGTISMDMIVIDLSAAPDLADGDWVSLPHELPVAAQQTALSQYELLTLLGDRFG